MAIVAADIEFRLSLPAGTKGATAVQADVNDSLGGVVASTQITDATINNLFDNVSGDDNAASDVEYRGYFVYNDHQTLDWISVKMWISASVTGGAVACIAVDSTASSTIGTSASQMLVIPTEDTKPTGLTFTMPETKGTGVSLGTINSNSVRGVWIRRKALNSAALNNDGITVSFEGDTAA